MKLWMMFAGVALLSVGCSGLDGEEASSFERELPSPTQTTQMVIPLGTESLDASTPTPPHDTLACAASLGFCRRTPCPPQEGAIGTCANGALNCCIPLPP
ncbi:hypothetical protein DRW03_35945 [Corallococcus sp. H22C18031201]|nr:hypothetical protein DRW03_35945 [Corallococcus sp. H22C18031201]